MYTLRPTEDMVQENCLYCFAQVDPILFCGALSLISSTLAPMHPAKLTVSIRTFTILSAFNLSICPSVRQHGTIRLPLDEFSRNLICEYFPNICRGKSNFIKIWQEYRILYMKSNKKFWSCLTQLFVERETFQTNFVQKISKHTLCLITFLEIV